MSIAESLLHQPDLKQGAVSRIAMPEPNVDLEQDAEWCLVETQEGWHEIRFHDYADLYEIPGLYERIFYEILNCNSPATIRSLIEKHAREKDIQPSSLRVLDLGAGNGMVGEELVDMGASTIVGVDIVEQAKKATERDRPNTYTDYLVADMTDLSEAELDKLQSYRFNCLTCVAALGFGDIPTEVFLQAYQLIQPQGLIAFNIKSTFMQEEDPTGFAMLIRRMIDEGILAVSSKIRYRHRLSTSGNPLEYFAFLGRKMSEVPGALQ